MNSIRWRLTLALLVSLAVVLTAGGLGVYYFTRALRLRDFDTMLGSAFPEIASLVNRVAAEGPPQERPFRFESRREGTIVYFEAWTSTGEVLGRSVALGDADLPSVPAGRKGPCQDITLPNGRRGRALTSSRLPSAEEASFTVGHTRPEALLTEKGRREIVASRARAARLSGIVLTVAGDRTELDRSLQRLALVLWGVGLSVLGLTALTVTAISRWGLAPLQAVANQAGQIDASKLDYRFPTAQLPAELKVICERLNNLLSRLESAFLRERRFSADVAHELRTPIAELRSLAEVALKWPGPDAAANSAFAEAREIALQMQGIANGLLAIARCEGGTQAVQREPVCVAEAARKSWEPFAAKSARKNLQVHSELHELAPIETDRAMLGQIMTNLFSNAVEYTASGGSLRFCLRPDGNGVDFRVTNAAHNLTPEDLPHLFDRFWRKDKARSSSEHSGIGLSVALAFARVLGMDLQASLSPEGLLTMRLSPLGRE